MKFKKIGDYRKSITYIVLWAGNSRIRIVIRIFNKGLYLHETPVTLAGISECSIISYWSGPQMFGIKVINRNKTVQDLGLHPLF